MQAVNFAIMKDLVISNLLVYLIALFLRKLKYWRLYYDEFT